MILYFRQLPLLASVPQRRRECSISGLSGLGSHPVFQGASLRLSALVVKLARAQTYSSFPATPPSSFRPFKLSGYAVHFRYPTIHRSTNIVNGELLKEHEEEGYQRDVPLAVSPLVPILARAIPSSPIIEPITKPLLVRSSQSRVCRRRTTGQRTRTCHGRPRRGREHFQAIAHTSPEHIVQYECPLALVTRCAVAKELLFVDQLEEAMPHDLDRQQDQESQPQPQTHHYCANLFGCGEENGTGVVREDLKDAAFNSRAADRLRTRTRSVRSGLTVS